MRNDGSLRFLQAPPALMIVFVSTALFGKLVPTDIQATVQTGRDAVDLVSVRDEEQRDLHTRPEMQRSRAVYTITLTSPLPSPLPRLLASWPNLSRLLLRLACGNG